MTALSGLAQIPRAILHPATCKHILKGHPWVTKDSFTARFPANSLFIVGVNKNDRKEMALLIHDPTHKDVKARVWSLDKKEWDAPFFEILTNRFKNAIKKRQKLFHERDNIVIINAEADLLPGLYIQKLKNHIVIGIYAFFWKNFTPYLVKLLKETFNDLEDIWIQERTFNQKIDIKSLIKDNSQTHFIINEFGVNYQIKINSHYDLGIYTDMSAIRKKIGPEIKGKRSLLNLFAYTGAFSLFGLSQNISEVISVDLSRKYLEWLEENLKLNPNILNQSTHRAIMLPCEDALIQLANERQTFDVIICDPPSASSDGGKMQSALAAYEKLLPLMVQALNLNGQIYAFLNTHNVSLKKFEEKLQSIIAHSKLNTTIVIEDKLGLDEDHLPLKGFPEGQYLKGFIIKKIMKI